MTGPLFARRAYGPALTAADARYVCNWVRNAASIVDAAAVART